MKAALSEVFEKLGRRRTGGRHEFRMSLGH